MSAQSIQGLIDHVQRHIAPYYDRRFVSEVLYIDGRTNSYRVYTDGRGLAALTTQRDFTPAICGTVIALDGDVLYDYYFNRPPEPQGRYPGRGSRR